MKGINMRAPALSEIYTQKMLHEVHRKKLEKIREQRKSHIGLSQNRLANIEMIKESKNKSFAHRFNQQSAEINRENLRLLVRLEQTKPYFRYTSHEHRESLQKSRESVALATPFLKRQVEEQEKQNIRLNNRVQSISSSLNQKNLMRDFVKSQRIKQRITRYTNENNKVTLKSQKYISNLSQSKLSHSSEANSVRPRVKSTTAQYYKKQDILKNQVENSRNSLIRIKNKLAQTLDQNNEENKESFFATQPEKNPSRRHSTRKC